MKINARRATLNTAWLFIVLAVTFPLVAHQQKAAITSVLFNSRSGNIEVMHRFLLHDAEHAVKVLFTKQADIYQSEQTQQAFADHVVAHFNMRDLQDRPIPLTTIGFELVGQYMWVYQEARQPEQLEGLMLSHSGLQSVWASQVNTVNIEGKGPIKTLTFTSNDTVKGVRFD